MRNPFTVTGNIEIVKNGEIFLNQKRVELLRQVREHGSINAASKELKMSYQQAWFFIQQMNELSPMPLVIRQRGGTNGGGASLTRFGERAISEFELLVNQHDAYKGDLSGKLWLCSF